MPRSYLIMMHCCVTRSLGTVLGSSSFLTEFYEFSASPHVTTNNNHQEPTPEPGGVKLGFRTSFVGRSRFSTTRGGRLKSNFGIATLGTREDHLSSRNSDGTTGLLTWMFQIRVRSMCYGSQVVRVQHSDETPPGGSSKGALLPPASGHGSPFCAR